MKSSTSHLKDISLFDRELLGDRESWQNKIINLLTLNGNIDFSRSGLLPSFDLCVMNKHIVDE